MYNLRTLIKYEYKKLLQRKSVGIVRIPQMLLTSVSVALTPSLITVSLDDDFIYTRYVEDTTLRSLGAATAG